MNSENENKYNNNKVALVLEGGAMRGLYTAGVLDVFMENDIKVDTIFGVSAGALFGINYKSNQIGRALRYNLKYAHDKRYMGMYSLITTGDIMNKNFCFNKLVYELDPLDFETYDNSNVKFYAVVTNVETGYAEYIEISDAKKDMEYLRASGSMPFVSNLVEINGNKYLDGAVADPIPFKKALDMNSNFDEIWFAQGELFVRTGKIGDAIDSFKKAFAINPKSGGIEKKKDSFH